MLSNLLKSSSMVSMRGKTQTQVCLSHKPGSEPQNTSVCRAVATPHAQAQGHTHLLAPLKTVLLPCLGLLSLLLSSQCFLTSPQPSFCRVVMTRTIPPRNKSSSLSPVGLPLSSRRKFQLVPSLCFGFPQHCICAHCFHGSLNSGITFFGTIQPSIILIFTCHRATLNTAGNAE